MNDSEIISQAKRHRTKVLAGRPPHLNCYPVCSNMSIYLNSIGIYVRLVAGRIIASPSFDKRITDTYFHFWLELEDGRILDPTASQFRINGQIPSAIFLGQKPQCYLEDVPPFNNEMSKYLATLVEQNTREVSVLKFSK